MSDRALCNAPQPLLVALDNYIFRAMQALPDADATWAYDPDHHHVKAWGKLPITAVTALMALAQEHYTAMADVLLTKEAQNVWTDTPV